METLNLSTLYETLFLQKGLFFTLKDKKSYFSAVLNCEMLLVVIKLLIESKSKNVQPEFLTLI